MMIIYRLQGCKKSAVIGWMAGMLLVAGCTQDKLADASQGEILPEGKYPVTFTATGLEISAVTRATADGTWEKSNEVAVKVEGESEAKKYTPANDGGTSTTLEAANGVTPFYWQSTRDIQVSAWYLDTEYSATLPSTWSVKPDQSSTGYQESDFLYAPEQQIAFKPTDGTDNSLRFYHQTAKVVINIRNNGLAAAVGETKSVTINAVTDGDFTTPLKNNCGLLAKTGVNPSEINSFRLTNPNTDVVFINGENGETALASFQALVIPQEVNNTTIIINIAGYAPFKYTPTGSWAGGTQYTYNLTIKGSVVTATVTNSISWGATSGGTGEGSVGI